MRISATGNGNAGFTLIEILGVLLLIGLALALVQPNIVQVAEKTRVRYVGELLQTDLQRALAEVKAGNPVTIQFKDNGYEIALGETVIARDYHANGLTFRVDQQELALPTPSASEHREAEESNLTTGDAVSKKSTISFIPNHPGPQATISWESKHYQGILLLQADDAVSWRYHVK